MEKMRILDEERLLTPVEYSNLCDKAYKGGMPVEYFRKNLFNATVRESTEYKRLRTIYDDGTNKVMVNRSLHQKHRDLLSILFTDNKGLVQKPNSDGAYTIKTNLYHVAKEMGYKNPQSSTEIVKNFLYDLRHTELVIKRGGIEDGGHRLIGEYRYDEENGDYLVQIPSTTSKFQILNYSVIIPKKINKQIIAIPNRLSKIKALVSYMLSNSALKNGTKFSSICSKLDINDSPNKSRFKRLVKDNPDLLQKFGITYEDDIFYYQQIEDIKFSRAVKASEIVGYIQRVRNDDEVMKFGLDKSLFVDKYLVHFRKDIFDNTAKVRSKILDIKRNEDGYSLKLEGGGYTKPKPAGGVMDLIEDGVIVDDEHDYINIG